MTTLPTFRLQVTRPPVRDPDRAEMSANSRKQGSFHYDREKGGYGLEWTCLAEFDAWRRQEEIANSIELIICKTETGKEYTQKRTYCCSRQPTGGDKHYKKKNLDWDRKIGSKKSGCGCRLEIKLYFHTPTVLGQYDADHDHEVGLANLAYTQMSLAARNKIYDMLEQRIDYKEIVSKTILIFNDKSDQSTDA